MKFSASTPLSVISLLGALANSAPIPEPDSASLNTRGTGQPIVGPDEPGQIENPAHPPSTPTGTQLPFTPTEPGESDPSAASPAPKAHKHKGEHIRVCHKEEKNHKGEEKHKHKCHKKLPKPHQTHTGKPVKGHKPPTPQETAMGMPDKGPKPEEPQKPKETVPEGGQPDKPTRRELGDEW